MSDTAAVIRCIGTNESGQPVTPSRHHRPMPERWTLERAEQLRRSVAMLNTGQPALDREDALEG